MDTSYKAGRQQQTRFKRIPHLAVNNNAVCQLVFLTTLQQCSNASEVTILRWDRKVLCILLLLHNYFHKYQLTVA